MFTSTFSPCSRQAQSRRAGINTKHFMRRAVVMRKGIDSVSPRVGPVVLGKTLFKNGRRIFGIRYNCPTIEQQGKNTVWENAVALENDCRLNEVVLFDNMEFLPVKYDELEVGIGTAARLSQKSSDNCFIRLFAGRGRPGSIRTRSRWRQPALRLLRLNEMNGWLRVSLVT